MLALVLLALLALICVWQIWRIALWYMNPTTSVWPGMFFFEPGVLVQGGARLTGLQFGPTGWPFNAASFVAEAAKLLVFLVIAIWLTIAQVRAWRKPPQGQS